MSRLNLIRQALIAGGCVFALVAVSIARAEASGCSWCFGNCSTLIPASVPGGTGCGLGACAGDMIVWCEDAQGLACGCGVVAGVPPAVATCQCK